jgi:hypothetical protein
VLAIAGALRTRRPPPAIISIITCRLAATTPVGPVTERRVASTIASSQKDPPMYRNYMIATLAFILMLAAPAHAQPHWTQVGMLKCKLNPSIGFIIAGHQSMECNFVPSNPNMPPQAYQGALNMLGLNIGISAGGVLGWAVMARTAGIPAGALAGEYVGASGDIALGLGAGANVLIGGSGRSVALQPVSLQGSIAVKVAVGVSALKLRPAM